MFQAIKLLAVGGLITLQILGNPVSTQTEIKADQTTQTKIEIQDYVIDELIDECDIEDADRVLNNQISDYLKNRF